MTASQARQSTEQAPLPEKTLRQLFLTLFLRGRTSRGLQISKAPASIWSKLALILAVYALFGLSALAFWSDTILALSAALHALSFVFLGMFVASSSGEMLFNREESDILLHRPVSPRDLLRAKVRVLVEVSLWLAGALNLASFFVGMVMPQGSWFYPIAHAFSITLETLFAVGCVVVMYQLCLRWFGRERLDSLMTTAQVLVAVSAALAGQAVPQLIGSFGGSLHLDMNRWWLALLPPVWFGAIDEALAGAGGASSWALGGFGLLATFAVVRVAFGKLAQDYERGLKALNESSTARRRGPRRRWLDVIVDYPPLCWWLRDSVARASFLLTAAYLVRDRDVKLRLYPGLAPMLVMPLVFLFKGGSSGFNAVFLGSFASMAAPAALVSIQYSQQWRAADIFRTAPMRGPAQLAHGARRAMLLLITLPVLAVFGVFAWLANSPSEDLMLAIPGLVALPILAIAPCVNGRLVPLSRSSEEAAAIVGGYTKRRVIGGLMVTFLPFIVSGLGALAQFLGWFWWFVAAEAFLAIALYIGLRLRMASLRWRPVE